MNRCSTGTDRKRQEWVQNGCEKTLISNASSCPKLGGSGNDYASTLTSTPSSIETRPQNTTNDQVVQNKVPEEVSKTALAHAMNDEPKTGGTGFVVGLLLPIVFIMSIVVWVFYAYRNPHTKSGQLLIQVRDDLISLQKKKKKRKHIFRKILDSKS